MQGICRGRERCGEEGGDEGGEAKGLKLRSGNWEMRGRDGRWRGKQRAGGEGGAKGRRTTEEKGRGQREGVKGEGREEGERREGRVERGAALGVGTDREGEERDGR